MIVDLAVAFFSAAVAILIYYLITFAGRAESRQHLLWRRSEKGLPVKASRLVQQFTHSLACLFGFHDHTVVWHPSGAIYRCKWCGKRGQI